MEPPTADASTSKPVRLVAAMATGSASHRMLSGDGPAGPWCGVGASHPVLGATATWIAVGGDAAVLDGRQADADGASSLDVAPTVDIDAASSEGLRAALEDAQMRLQVLDAALSARSTLVAVQAPNGPVAAWLGLGPPSCGVLVRCWPGVIQGPDAAGEDAAPAALALAAEETAAAIAAGRLSAAEVSVALAVPRAEAFAEGMLAERHARLMDAAGDDRGAAIRRVVAQAYAVDLALQALRALLSPMGGQTANRG